MINFSNSTFIKSAPTRAEKPQGFLPEVLICGKSNVGKSSLINALCNQKQLAYTSSKPGHTRMLNYYNIDNSFYLVDAPGYGYAKGGIDLDRLFGEMMESYFVDNRQLKLVLVLLDSRRELTENDLEIIDYVKENNIPYLLVVTKIDKVNQSEKAKLMNYLAKTNIDKELIYLTSATMPKSLAPLKQAIAKSI